MVACASLQWGHWKSANSTSRRSLDAEPRAGPSALCCRMARFSAKGLAPNGSTSSAMMCLPSGSTKNCRLAICGFPPAWAFFCATNTTTLVTLAAAVFIIAWICQVRLVSYPHDSLRNSLIVSAVGLSAVKFFGSGFGNGLAGSAVGVISRVEIGEFEFFFAAPAGGAGACGVALPAACASAIGAATGVRTASANTAVQRDKRSCIEFLSSLVVLELNRLGLLIPEP